LNSEVSVEETAALDSLFSTFVYKDLYSSENSGFDAVVSNDDLNPGDYTSIVAAFAAGRQDVYVRNGTYYEMGDIIIPDRGQLVGESPGKVFVILPNGGAVKILGLGNGAYESSGTNGIVSGTSIVTGVGTSFTNLTPGQFILLGTNFYDIASIESDTSLTLEDTYIGKTLISKNMKAHSLFSGIRLANMIVYGALGKGIVVTGLRHGSFSNVAIYKCVGTGICFLDCAELSIQSLVVNSCGGDGVSIDKCITVSMNTVNNYNNGGNGYSIMDCQDVNSISCTSESNGLNGYDISAGSRSIALSACILRHNNLDGARIRTGAKTVTANCINSSQNGINGISVDYSENFYLMGSEIRENDENGIVAKNGSNNVSILGNVVCDNRGRGILLDTVTRSKIGYNDVCCEDLSSTGPSCEIAVQGVSSNLTISNNNSSYMTIGASVTKSIISLNVTTEAEIDDSSTGGITNNNLFGG